MFVNKVKHYEYARAQSHVAAIWRDTGNVFVVTTMKSRPCAG
jgi:hypothetical protein